MSKAKLNFVPIARDEYIDAFLIANPGECRDGVASRIDDAISAYRSGKLCQCGNEIWIVGSAEAGYGCFTCITGEKMPTSDYEIDLSGC